MRTLIMFVFCLLISASAFAADSFTVKRLESEGETLGVFTVFNVRGRTIKWRVPVYGTYDKAYVVQSLKNMVNTLRAKTDGELDTLQAGNADRVASFLLKENRAAETRNAKTTLATEVDKEVIVP